MQCSGFINPCQKVCIIFTVFFYISFLPLLMRKTSHLSFDMRFFLNALIAWSRLKRHVVIPPFLCCFPLISWAYLFVCKTHTANAKDLFAAGKTISVTHLFSWSFFRASLLGWNVQQKCSSTLLMHSWAKSQRKQNLNILETIFHIWNPLDVFILGSSIWLCFDVMGNEKERFIDSQKSLWCWENNRQLLAWGIFMPLHICVAETATRTLGFGGAA